MPFLVGAPRTETWARSLESSVPRPGLLIVDADRGALAYHPDDADLVELPEAEAVESAIEEMVGACRRGDDRAGRHCCRVVGRHARSAAPRSPSRRRRSGGRGARSASARGRESLEFAELVKRSSATRARGARCATCARAWATPSTRARRWPGRARRRTWICGRPSRRTRSAKPSSSASRRARPTPSTARTSPTGSRKAPRPASRRTWNR